MTEITNYTNSGHKFLNDNKGNKSSMRLIFILSFIVASLLAFITMFLIYKGKSDAGAIGVSLVGLFLGIGTAGKVGQTITENK